MKKKAFTLVELLVVIAIIAMLLAILMPALSRVRQLAFQMICGTNESGLGKAILLYSNENEEKYPEFGPPGSATSWIEEVQDPLSWSEPDTLANHPEIEDAVTTVTSSLYLLVKYADVNPAQFICSAHKATKFELDDYDLPDDEAQDITECWDFGDDPAKHVSYSYNYPYTRFSPDGSSPPAVPLIADLSPWMGATAAGQTDSAFIPPQPPSGDQAPQLVDYSESDQQSKFKLGNSPTHGLEGQNILFNDMHVKFMKTPNVGVEQDNIYTRWSADPAAGEDIDAQVRQQGMNLDTFIMVGPEDESEGGPLSEEDAVLVQW